MAQLKEVDFLDGITRRVGDRVEYYAGENGWLAGTITAISDREHSPAVEIHVKVDEPEKLSRFDRYPLKTGGFFDRLIEHGVGGGCLRTPEAQDA